jgi:hypothetical protein
MSPTLVSVEPSHELPKYSKLHAEDIPPAYSTFPTAFVIGQQETDGSLVDAAQVNGHLALLNAFASLKQQVSSLPFTNWRDYEAQVRLLPQASDERWRWFVSLAVERFVYLWSGTL